MALFLLLLFSNLSCDRPASASSGDTIRLELWTLALRPKFNDYLGRLIADFEATHPGIKVTWIDVPDLAMARKFLAAAAAGRPPDVINLSDRHFARFASLGAFADVESILPVDAKSTYVPGALAVCRIDGVLRAVPWYLTTGVRLMNTELLAQGGLSPATLGHDWATIRKQARDFHAKTGKFLITVCLGQDSDLPQLMLADALPPLRPRNDGVGLESNLLDKSIVSLVSEWVDLYRSGCLPREAATKGFEHLMTNYQDGETAVINTGAISRIRDAAPDIYRKTAVGSAITGARGRSHIAVMTVGVCANSPHPREAAMLAAHLTSAKWQLEMAKLVNILPSVNAALTDSMFTPPDSTTLAGDEGRIRLSTSLAAGQLKDAIAFTPTLGVWPDLRRAFNERIKAALQGRDVRETLEQISAEWNSILASGEPAKMSSLPAGETR